MLDDEGRVEDSTLARAGVVRLSPEQMAEAQRGPLFIENVLLPETGDRAKLLVVPVRGEDRSRVVVVGSDTEARDEALTDLLQLLLIGGPVALLLASIAGYGVAAAALRPVEAMRSRAADISAAVPDQRLPVPPSGDEIARLGRTLNEMLDRLGEAIEHERSFVADASHELRTPLAILRTELELALAEGRSPEELRAALASAAEETDRLNQLSEDLLTIAQTERGELPLRLTPTDLEETFAAVAQRFERRAGRSGALDRGRGDWARGHRRPAAARPGDRQHGRQLPALRRRLDHLEAQSEREGGLRSTSATAAPASGGVPRAGLRALQPALAERGDGGSGLGLAIVRTVARAHGGEAARGQPRGRWRRRLDGDPSPARLSVRLSSNF